MRQQYPNPNIKFSLINQQGRFHILLNDERSGLDSLVIFDLHVLDLVALMCILFDQKS